MNYTQNHAVKKSGFRTNHAVNNRRAPAKKQLDAGLFIKKSQEINEIQYLSDRTIKDLPVDEAIILNLLKKGYKTPTEIQDKSIEPILGGADIMGLAQTGTGKTGAFLIPLIHNLIGTQPSNQVLIITPTRELAVQIEQEFRSIAAGLRLFSGCFIGGTSVRQDMIKLKKPSHIIIGTPGRLTDMIRQRAIEPGSFSALVLDEFDRLLDMGFLNDIMRIVDGMKNRKQTILFSATEDKSQKSVISKLLKNAVEVRLRKGNSSADNIDQGIIRVADGENKMKILLDLISDPAFEKVLIFADTKNWVSRICKHLRKAGVKADEIHGNKSQNYRLNVLKAFKNQEIKVLVATDVAARGLDIVNVSHVINYHQPQCMESYIHRIGRTGRAGKSGKALTFVN